MEELLIAALVLMLFGLLVSGPIGLFLGLWSVRELKGLRCELRALPASNSRIDSQNKKLETTTMALASSPPAASESPVPMSLQPSGSPETTSLRSAPEDPAPLASAVSPPPARPPRWRPSPEQAAMWVAASLGGLR